MLLATSSRKEIAERTISRWKALGIDIDGDPEFMTLLGLWISGSIGSTQMRSRYVSIMRSRLLERRNRPRLEPIEPGSPTVGEPGNTISTEEFAADAALRDAV